MMTFTLLNFSNIHSKKDYTSQSHHIFGYQRSYTSDYGFSSWSEHSKKHFLNVHNMTLK